MGSRPAFKANVIALTGAMTVSHALSGWSVIRRIAAKDTMGACELCGTRFKRGAWVRHVRHQPEISVGGDCLQTLLLGKFAAPATVKKKATSFRQKIRKRYQGIVDPANWLKWIVEHAPKSHAAAVVQLEHLGYTDGKSLEKLIAFHDRTRRYSIKLFFDDFEIVMRSYKVDEEITINKARQIEKKMASGEGHRQLQKAWLHEYLDEFEEEIAEDEIARHSWRSLGVNGRRTVLAVYALVDTLENPRDWLCSKELAENWPHVTIPIRASRYVWHPRVGIGFVEFDPDDLPSDKEKVWLFGTGDYTQNYYFLKSWYEVSGAKETAIKKLERAAYDIEVG